MGGSLTVKQRCVFGGQISRTSEQAIWFKPVYDWLSGTLPIFTIHIPRCCILHLCWRESVANNVIFRCLDILDKLIG